MKKLILIFFAFSLFGCASNQVNTFISGDRLNKDHGLVVVTVNNNIDRISHYFDNWREVIAYPIDDKNKKYYSLHTRGDGNVSKFYGQMPPGKYYLGLLYSHMNDGYVSAWARHPIMPLSQKFEIHKNKVTNLGEVIFQPINLGLYQYQDKEKGVSGYIAFSESDNSENIEKIREKDLRNRIDYKEFIMPEEVPIKYQNLNQDLVSLSRKNFLPNGFSKLNDETGSLIVYGNLGGYHYRLNNDSEFKHGVVGSLSKIISVSYVNGRYYFINHDREVFFTSELGQETKPLVIDSEYKTIISLHEGENESYAYTEDKRYYYIFAFKNISDKWAEVGRLEKKLLSMNDDVNQAFISHDGMLIILDQDQRYKLTQSKEWAKSKTQGFEIIYRQKDGALIGFSDGILSDTLMVSKDYGKNWVELPRYVNSAFSQAESSPVLITDEKIFTLGSFRKSKKNQTVEGIDEEEEAEIERGSKRHLYLLVADYQNLTDKIVWKKQSVVPKECQRLLAEISQWDEMYILCRGSSMKVSKNQGLTWKNIGEGEISIQKDFEDIIKKYVPSKQ